VQIFFRVQKTGRFRICLRTDGYGYSEQKLYGLLKQEKTVNKSKKPSPSNPSQTSQSGTLTNFKVTQQTAQAQPFLKY
jgi:hypothetical protein